MEMIELFVEGFLEYQEGCSYSKDTIRRNRYFLKRFRKWLNGRDIRNMNWKTISSYREYLKQVKSCFSGNLLSPATVTLEMKILKSFFDYLFSHDKILTNPLEGIKLTEKGAGKLRPVFTEEDINIFLDSITLGSIANQRNRALFELVYSSGLRVNEVLTIRCEDLNLEERVLVVKGKGSKDRYVPFSDAARTFLIRYISGVRKVLERGIRKKENRRYLFLGRIGALTYGALKHKFKKYLKNCGLDKKGYTIHSIRHSTGTHLLEEGAGIRYVQELLGHEDLKTTQLYTRPAEENVRKVYRTYHPRENEYFKEVDDAYLKGLKDLKKHIAKNIERNRSYKRSLRLNTNDISKE